MSEPSQSENKGPTPNAIEWNELITPDPRSALEFYTGLFGWQTEKFPMPHMEYTMLKIGDRMFGGVVAPPREGIPPHWLNYVSVTDIEATLEKAKSLGATVHVDVMDIGEAGRIAIISDPQGATIGLHSM